VCWGCIAGVVPDLAISLSGSGGGGGGGAAFEIFLFCFRIEIFELDFSMENRGGGVFVIFGLLSSPSSVFPNDCGGGGGGGGGVLVGAAADLLFCLPTDILVFDFDILIRDGGGRSSEIIALL
jgi:hypothetical protein